MIATIRLKDIIKYIFYISLISIIIISIIRFLNEFKKNNKEIMKKENKNAVILSTKKIVNVNIPLFNQLESINQNSREKNSYSSISGISRMLMVELPYLEDKNEAKESKKIAKEDIENIGKDENEKEKEKANTEESIDIKETYTNKYKSVKIKNLTKNINLTEEMLLPNYEIKNKKDIVIFHTHTCESYTKTNDTSYISSGNFRTTDLKYSVAKVGDELEEELKKLKYNVIHDKTLHDYPAYTGSYERSLKTLQKILEKKNDIDIIFDIHRDAIGSNSSYAPTLEISGEKVAKLMFVIGTNDGGGKHPNWINNLKFAVAVQEKANEMYPGLFRPINLRSATFNQKISPAASIIEVGATGNTLEEARASMKYLAKVLNELLK